MKRQMSVEWVFFLAAALFVVAGLLPLVKGRPLNAVFLALSAVWFILGLAVAAKARKGA